MSEALGHKVRRLRDNAGLSQEELARRADVSKSTIQNVESGMRQPRPGSLARIAQALDTSVPALMRDSDGASEEPTMDELKAARRVLIEALRMDDLERKQELLADALSLVGRAMEHGRYHETG